MIIRDVAVTASLVKYSWVQTEHVGLSFDPRVWTDITLSAINLYRILHLSWGIAGIWSNYKAVRIRTLHSWAKYSNRAVKKMLWYSNKHNTVCKLPHSSHEGLHFGSHNFAGSCRGEWSILKVAKWWGISASCFLMSGTLFMNFSHQYILIWHFIWNVNSMLASTSTCTSMTSQLY